jgi:hypothetical protein
MVAGSVGDDEENVPELKLRTSTFGLEVRPPATFSLVQVFVATSR